MPGVVCLDAGQIFDDIDTLLIFKLSATVAALLLFVILRWAVRRAISNYARTHRFAASRSAFTHRAVSVFGSLALLGVLALAWSINFHNFLAATGAVLATIGIGFFAGWSILSNVTASFIMIWRFPMHVGVRIGLITDKNFVAEVKEFTPFFIILEDSDGNEVTLPNSLTLQQMFVIYRGEKQRRKTPASDEAGVLTGQYQRER